MAEVLACAPQPAAVVNFRSTVKLLDEIVDSARVLAARPGLHDEVEGVRDTIENLCIGKPPRDQDMPTLSSMTMQMLKACESSYQLDVLVEVQTEKKDVVKKVEKKRLCGAAAIKWAFSVMEERMKECAATVDVKSLMPLRQFRWVLEAGQKAQVQAWLRQVMLQKEGAGTVRAAMLTAAVAADDLAIIPAGAVQEGGSSSSSALCPIVSPGKKGGSAKDKAAHLKVLEDRAQVMQFFTRQKSRTKL